MFASKHIVLCIVSSVPKLQRKIGYAYCTSNIKEKTVKIDKWNINYVKVGRGPHHILCMPGTLGTIWTDFKFQIEGFDRSKFTLVVWDPPGYGKSRPPLKKFTTDLYETDADHAYRMMKILQIPKYSLLGWSGGGITSLFLAAKYPDVMQKLVVWGGLSTFFPHELDWYKNMRDIDTWSDQMKKPFIDVYGKELLSAYWSQWVNAIEAQLNEKQGNFCSHLLKLIKCPTFVLVGERDRVVDPAHAYYLVKNIADARLHVMHNLGGNSDDSIYLSH